VALTTLLAELTLPLGYATSSALKAEPSPVYDEGPLSVQRSQHASPRGPFEKAVYKTPGIDATHDFPPPVLASMVDFVEEEVLASGVALV